jgi:hypothetical protein
LPFDFDGRPAQFGRHAVVLDHGNKGDCCKNAVKDPTTSGLEEASAEDYKHSDTHHGHHSIIPIRTMGGVVNVHSAVIDHERVHPQCFVTGHGFESCKKS